MRSVVTEIVDVLFGSQRLVTAEYKKVKKKVEEREKDFSSRS